MDEIEKYDFGLRLKRLRERKDLSQAELARKLNVSKASINRYENNIQSPTLANAKRLAEILDTTLDYLAGIDTTQVIKVDNCSEKQIAWITYTIKEILNPNDAE